MRIKTNPNDKPQWHDSYTYQCLPRVHNFSLDLKCSNFIYYILSKNVRDDQIQVKFNSTCKPHICIYLTCWCKWSCHTILSYSYVFSYQTDFKNLQSLEMCGGGLTDAGVKNIKDLASLTLLNLSQNYNLTDKTLELASGIFCLSSLICVPAVALLNIIILVY